MNWWFLVATIVGSLLGLGLGLCLLVLCTLFNPGWWFKHRRSGKVGYVHEQQEERPEENSGGS